MLHHRTNSHPLSTPWHRWPTLIALTLSIGASVLLAQPRIYWLDDLTGVAGSVEAVANNGDLVGRGTGTQSSPGYLRRFASGEIVVGYPSGVAQPLAIDSAGVHVGTGRQAPGGFAEWWDGAQRWGGLNDLGEPLVAGGSNVTGFSYDGLVAVGYITGNTSVLKEAGFWERLGENTLSLSLSLSTTNNHHWFADGVSGDGRYMVGTYNLGNGNRAFRWTRSASREDLGSLGGGDSTAAAINWDGSMVLGSSETTDDAADQLFVWTEIDGMQALPFWDANATISDPIGMSGDGRLILANESYGANPLIYVDGVPHLFQDYLDELEATGRQERLVTGLHAISPDGRYIVGSGLVGGVPRLFLADMGAAYRPVHENIYAQVGEQIAISSGQDLQTDHKWYRDGVEVEGQTGETLIIPVVSLADAGAYTFATFSEIDGWVFSAPVQLHVSETGATPLPEFGQRHPFGGPAGNLVDVLHDQSNGVFVAYGRGGLVYTSTDGVAWNRKPDSPFNYPQAGAMLWTGTQYLMVGDQPSAYVSTDLTSWTEAGSFAQGNKHAVAQVNATLVAVGPNGSIERSVDGGQSWSAVESGTTSSLSAIHFGYEGFWAISRDGTVVNSNSQTGISWNQVTLPEGYQNRHLIGLGRGVGDDVWIVGSDTVLHYQNGTWDVVETGYAGNFSDVLYTGQIVLSTWEGTVLADDWDDLTTWAEIPMPAVNRGTSLLGLAGGSGGAAVVAVGNGGTIFRSTDSGAGWESVGTIGATNELFDVSVVDGEFHAVGSNGVILTSPDGRNWFQRQSFTGHWLSDAFQSGGYTYLPTNWGNVLRSLDGENWDDIETGDHFANNGHALANGEILLVGDNGQVRRSSDGSVWSTAQIPGADQNLSAVAARGDLVVAVGDAGGVFVSTDNINWTRHDPSPGTNWRSVRVIDGVFFITGYNSQLFVSTDGQYWHDLSDDRLGWGINDIVKGPDGYYFPTGTAHTDVTKTKDFQQIEGVAHIGSVDLRRAAVAHNAMVLVGEGGAIYSTDLPDMGIVPFLQQNLPDRVDTLLGDTLFLQVFATGAEPLTYQWTKDGEVIAGANGPMLIRPNAGEDDAGDYMVTVTTVNNDPVESNTATVNVAADPAITRQPPFMTLVEFGGSVSLSVAADGALSYQWYRDGGDLTGATGPTLSLTDVSPDDNGAYTVVIDTINGPLTSRAAHLIGYATPDDTYPNIDTISPDPLIGTLQNVIHDGSQFVAIGRSGKLVTSTDGINWGAGPDTPVDYPEGLAYDGSSYFIVGDHNRLVRSADLDTWTDLQSNTDHALTGIGFAGDLLIAVGSNGTIVTSADGGDTWASATSPTGEYLHEAGGTSGSYVVVGNGGTILHSTDGGTWSQITAPEGYGHRELRDVEYLNGQFVIVGTEGAVLTSTDGVNWTVRANEIGAWFDTVSFDGTRYWLSHYTSSVFFTTDFSSFTESYPQPIVPGSGFTGVASHDGITVLAGAGMNLFTSSNGGNSWTSAGSRGGSSELREVVRLNGEHVTVGSNGLLLTSPDTRTWTQRQDLTGDWLQGVVYGHGQYVVVGHQGVILAGPSLDELQFRRDESDWRNLYAVAVTDRGYVASGLSGHIRHSTDGVNWVAVDVPGATSDLWGIAAIGDTVVTAGNNGEFFTSTDGGLTWTTNSISNNGSFRRVRAIDGAFYVMGENQAFAVSVDGLTWREISLPWITWSINDMIKGPDAYYFAMGGPEGRLARMPSLGDWSEVDGIDYVDLFSLSFNPDGLALVGEGATIATSFGLPTAPDGLAIQRGLPEITTYQAGEDFLLQVFASAPSGELSFQWDHNGTDIPGATAAVLFLDDVDTADLGTYTLTVSGGGTTVTATTTLAEPVVPEFTAQPEGGSATIGGELTLVAEATVSGGAVSYQWRHQGIWLDGETGPSLTLANLQPGQSGYYDVVAFGGGSDIASDSVYVEVTPPLPVGPLRLDPTWDVVLENAGGAIYDIEPTPDGGLLLAGNFREWVGHVTDGLVRLDADGAVDTSLRVRLARGSISDVALQANGRILIAGDFSLAAPDGQTREGTARLLASGALDTSLSADVTGFIVSAAPNGTIFTLTNSTLAIWDENGVRDDLVDLTFDGFVREVRATVNNQALVIGDFTAVNGEAHAAIVRINSDGSIDENFTSGLPTGAQVWDLARDASTGKIWVGGPSVVPATHEPSSGVTRLNSDGTVDFGTHFGGGNVYSIALAPTGGVVVGGDFTEVGGSQLNNGGEISWIDGVAVANLARLDAGGALITTNTPTVNRTVRDVGNNAAGDTVIAGDFDTFDDIAFYGVGAMDAAGNVFPGFGQSMVSNGRAHSVLPTADGKIILAGPFTRVNGHPAVGLARLHGDGSFDSSFDQGSGFNGLARFADLAANGDILVVGNFSSFNGTETGQVVRLHADGSLDTGFDSRVSNLGVTVAPGSQFMDATSDGGALVGGYYWHNGPLSVAHFNPDGSLDESFGSFPALSSNYSVLHDRNNGPAGGHWVASGQFWNHPRGYALLHPDGTLNDAFTGAIDLDIGVVIQPSDGAVYVGGFNLGSTTPVPSLFRLFPDGTQDVDFVGPAVFYLWNGNFNRHWQRVIPQADGGVVLGGNFRLNADGDEEWDTDRRVLARFLPNGSLDQDFVIEGLSDHVATAVEQAADGQFLVAIEGRVVRTGPLPPEITVQPEPVAVTVGEPISLSVEAPEATAFQWRVDGVPIAGQTGAMLQLASATLADAGFYDVEVIGDAATTTVPVRVDVFAAGQPTVLHDDPTWNFVMERFGTTVNDVVAAPGGGFFVAGSFIEWDGHPTRGVVKLLGDGAVDENFTAAIDGTPTAIGVQPSGKLIVTGSVSADGPTGERRSGILRLDAGGVLDATFQAPFDRGAGALGIAPDGSIFVAGNIAVDVDNDVYRALVHLGVDGAHDAVFSPDLRTADGGLPFVRTIVPVSATEVYVGADSLATINGIAVDAVVKLVAQIGVPDSTFRTNLPDSVQAFEIARDSNGKLWIAAAGQTMRIATDGTPELTLPAYHGSPFSLTVLSDNSVVVAGDMGPDENDSSRVGFARYTNDGTLVGAFAPVATGRVTTISADIDDDLLFGGGFTQLNSVTVTGVGMIDADGDPLTGFSPAPVSRGVAYAVTPMDDGSFLVGGDFDVIGGVAKPKLARVTAAGAVDPVFPASGAPNNSVYFVERAGPDSYVISGAFNAYGEVAVPNFIRIGANGALDDTFNIAYPYWGPGGSELIDLYVGRDGSTLSTGWFWAPERVQHVVRNRPDGSHDASFELHGPGLDGSFAPFFDLVAGPGGTYFGGGFFATTLGNAVYKFDHDGLIDEVFAGAVPDFSSLATLRVAGDQLYLAGTPPSSSSPALVRVGFDGQIDPNFTAPRFRWGWGARGPRAFFFPEADGSLVVGGNFAIDLSESETIEQPVLTRLGPDGTYDPALVYDGERLGGISAMQQLPDGNFVIASAGKLVRTMSEVTLITDPPVATDVTFGEDLVLTVGTVDETGLSFQWLLNGTELPGATASTLTITDAPLAAAGYYAVRVTGATVEQSEPVRVNIVPAVTPGILEADPTWKFLVERIGMQPFGMVGAADGGFFLWGDATGVDQHQSFGVVKLHTDGTVDDTFSVTQLTGSVSHLAEQSDGKIVIGGDFVLEADGREWRGLARLDAEGKVDPNFADASVNPLVSGYAVAVAPNGMIYFARDGGLARADANGVVDDAPFGPTFAGETSNSPFIRDILVQSDNRVVVVGEFDTVGGEARHGLVRLNTDGSVDANMVLPWTYDENDYPSGAGYPWSLEATTDGSVWLTMLGDYRYGDTVANGGLVRFSAAGAVDRLIPFPAGNSFSLAAVADGSLYVAGAYLRLAENGDLQAVIRIDDEGAIDSGFTFPAAFADLRQLAVGSGGQLLTTGTVQLTETDEFSYKTRLFSAADGLLSDLALRLRSFGRVRGYVPQADGSVFVGGEFNYVNGTPVNHLARLTPAGQLDPSFDPGDGLDGAVWLLSGGPDGMLYVFGWFGSYDGTPVGAYIRIDANGALDETFTHDTGNEMHLLAPRADGGMFVSGWDWDGVLSRNAGLARHFSDGARDRDFTVLINGEGRYGSAQLALIEGPNGQVVSGGFVSQQYDNRGLGFMDPSGNVNVDATAAANVTDFVYGLMADTEGIWVVSGGEEAVRKIAWDGTAVSGFGATSTSLLWRGEFPRFRLFPQADGGMILAGPAIVTPDGQQVVSSTLTRFSADGTWDDSTFLLGESFQDVQPVVQLVDGGFVYFDGRIGRLHRTREAVLTAPAIIAAPTGAALDEGDDFALAVRAIGTGELSYQWQKDGVDIVGATDRLLDLPNLTGESAGAYTVVVTDDLGSTTSDPVQVDVETGEPPVRALLNLSARLELDEMGRAYAPFRIQGGESKLLLFRAVGPSLADLGVTGAMSDPRLRLLDHAGIEILSNDNWGDLTENADSVASIGADVGAFALSTGSLDAATVALLGEGNYILEVTGTGPGTVLVDIFDADAAGSSTRLVHLAVGAHYEAGDGFVGGLVVATAAEATQDLILRAVGPGLPWPNALPDPVLTLFDGLDEIAANDDWSDSTGLTADFLDVGAPPLPVGSADAAFRTALGGGAYALSLSSGDGGSGPVLVEVYDTDRVAAPVAPFVLIPPVDSDVQEGESAFFAVYAGGLGPLSYQWQLDGVDLVGATAARLDIAAASLSDAGDYRVRIMSGQSSVTTAAATLTVAAAPSAPVIDSQPVSTTVPSGSPATFTVVASGDGPLSYQWYEGNSPIVTAPVAGATGASFTTAALTETTTYWVRVTNAVGSVDSATATATVLEPSTTTASHSVVGGGYVAGGTVSITNTFTYEGGASAIGWTVDLPDGWSYASTVFAEFRPDVRPSSGTTGTLGWAYSEVPPSGASFTYTLNVPAGTTGVQTLSASLLFRSGSAPEETVIATPAPLQIGERPSLHSADTDQDNRIGLSELLRVIELYNTRFGTSRTGRYRVAAGTEDGFESDPSLAADAGGSLATYHSADSDQDALISLSELLRIIELYNYRSGTTRTGEYHLDATTEDGFAAGPSS